MTYKVGVIGATGAVGQEILSILYERHFPMHEVVALASKRSVGKSLYFNQDDPLMVQDLEQFDFKGTDIVLSSPGSRISAQYCPKAVAAGSIVIDNTAQFRMDPDVPLIVPEVNPDMLLEYGRQGIISNPNCSTIQMVVALKPLHDLARIERVRVATYQSVSGAGSMAIEALRTQTRAIDQNESWSPDRFSKFSKQIAFNVIPHIDQFMEHGMTKEEWKMEVETQKILDSQIAVHATCVRVPVVRSHGVVIDVSFRDRIGVEEARMALRHAPGVVLVDPDDDYITPVEAAGKDAVFVARLRQDFTVENGLSMWVVSDNLRKGAALNAVQIAELLIKT